ncbi:MAG: hypothetical protein ABH880_03105 [Patescibacteria group bacterium]
MPTINVYSEDKLSEKKIADKLRPFAADKLSCGDITLKPEEVSVRFIKSSGLMIGNVELEIAVHSFEERVKRQDKLANEFRDFLMSEFPELGDVRVWLKLSELGHSF